MSYQAPGRHRSNCPTRRECGPPSGTSRARGSGNTRRGAAVLCFGGSVQGSSHSRLGRCSREGGQRKPAHRRGKEGARPVQEALRPDGGRTQHEVLLLRNARRSANPDRHPTTLALGAPGRRPCGERSQHDRCRQVHCTNAARAGSCPLGLRRPRRQPRACDAPR